MVGFLRSGHIIIMKEDNIFLPTFKQTSVFSCIKFTLYHVVLNKKCVNACEIVMPSTREQVRMQASFPNKNCLEQCHFK